VQLSRHNVRYPRPGLQFLEHLLCFPVGRSLAFPTNPPRFIRAWDRHWQLRSYSIHPAPTRGGVGLILFRKIIVACFENQRTP
jgi:hypothetical protein